MIQGVPVLTLPGVTFASRVALSISHQMGTGPPSFAARWLVVPSKKAWELSLLIHLLRRLWIWSWSWSWRLGAGDQPTVQPTGQPTRIHAVLLCRVVAHGVVASAVFASNLKWELLR